MTLDIVIQMIQKSPFVNYLIHNNKAKFKMNIITLYFGSVLTSEKRPPSLRKSIYKGFWDTIRSSGPTHGVVTQNIHSYSTEGISL